MTTWIALFRGINVGGNNPLPMQALKATLGHLGCHNVNTYIQSGNVAFSIAGRTAQDLKRDIEGAISREFGFAVTVHLLSITDLAEAVASNPFAAAATEPTSLHLFFLDEEPDAADLDGLHKLSSKTENFELQGTTFYLHAPDGIGRSKLAAAAEKLLGVGATARNWRTVTKTLEMARQLKCG